RCTGYRPIREAAEAVAGTAPADGFARALQADASALPALRWVHDGAEAHVPTDFDHLFEVLAKHPDARLVAGATDVGLDVTKKGARFACMVSLHALPLRGIVRTAEGGWRIGATTRLSDLELAVQDDLPALARMLRFFGSRQIKNRGTVGGNLCNASPIGDLAPVLLALDATLVLRSAAGERRVGIDDFFLAYRKTALGVGEILAAVEIPPVPADARLSAYKVSKRREMDISAVACGLLVRVGADGLITHARFGFGGMAATPARAAAAEAAVIGQPFSAGTFAAAADASRQDFNPLSDHRGSAWYRATVASNLLKGFFHEVHSEAAPALADRPSGTLLTPSPATPHAEAAR
ncbi:MAG: FAD binding domain-containing protein, partial [Myxococcales bacterium]|nr:FAD binding domain-containing protein [Myxococcales bacterium]